MPGGVNVFATGQTVIAYMEQLAPKHIAMPKDCIGLQLGTLDKEIRHVLITLDVTDEVIDEAISLEIDLIIAHHPIIFDSISSLQTNCPIVKRYEKLIKHNIAVYISHTNLDVAEGGLNDWLAQTLGIETTGTLEDSYTDDLFKLVVFVPCSHHDLVLQALFCAGAGSIGNYTHCSFNMNGTGTFVSKEGAQPYIGKRGEMEHVEEVRIETVVSRSLRTPVVQAMLKAHPYEEVAYDLYPIDIRGHTVGIGRIGYLEQSLSLRHFVDEVKGKLHLPGVRVVGNLESVVKNVAVLGGSGSKYIRIAQAKGAHVLVTGDVNYHAAQDALMFGLAIVDVGHHVETIMKPNTAKWLRTCLQKMKYSTRVYTSKVENDPFQFM